MKKICQISFLSAIAVLCISTFVNADTFTSMTGGNWNDPFIWDQSDVPTASDDVIISAAGIVYVNVAGLVCNDLTVNAGATLRNPDWVNVTLTVYGDVLNNGTITNSNYELSLSIYGDIVNNGEWTFHQTHLAGAATQFVSLGSGSEFACEDFIDDDPSSETEALTDLTFTGVDINSNNGQFVMPTTTGGTLTLHGGSLFQIDLITHSGTLYMDGDAGIYQNSIIRNATLDGTVILKEDPVTFEGETINNGILKNRDWKTFTWCFIEGNITNNGTIQDSNYDLYLRCDGNITNNGVWSNHYTQMMSLNTHEIYQGGAGEFTGENFVAADTTGTITVMTNFNFNGTEINLNGVTMDLDNSKGANLSILSDYLSNGVFKGNGQSLYMHNSSYLQDMTVENTTLLGIVRISGNGVTFNGNMIVEDTLQSRTNVASTLTVNDLLTNNGLIKDSNYDLFINVYGDIVNDGVWINERITMAGSADQYISCLNGNAFGTYTFYDSDISSNTICADKVTFSSTRVNLSAGRLVCAGNEIEFINAARVSNSEIEDAVITGTLYVGDSDVHFYGATINDGIIRNFDNTTTSTYVHGDMNNNGTIHKSNYNFHIYFYSDIINNGTWTFSTMHMASPTAQYLTLDTGQEFACLDFVNDDPLSPIIANTDLTFNGTDINFNNGQLILPATKGGTLTLHSGYLYKIDLITNSGTLYMDNGAYIRTESIIHNATLDGTIILQENQITFEGETVNNGILRDATNTTLEWIYIDGNFTNNNTVQDSNYDLYLRCNGNITNNGEWSNHYTQMMSYNTHEISQGGIGEFTGENFVAADTTGTIAVLTDFNFNATEIDLNGVTLELNEETGGNLSVQYDYMKDGNIIGNGQNLYMHNDSYLQDITIENTNLQGIVRISGNGVTFNGNMIVEDTLQSRYNVNSTLTVNDVLTNNGLIQNSNYQLYMNIFGDIINNGIWTTNNINMSSATDQYISCLNGNVFAPSHFSDADITSKTICAGDIGFDGTDVNLSGGRIDCAGYGLECLNAPRFASAELEDAVISGTLYVENDNVHFYGRTTNNGTIRNFDWDNIDTYFHGDIFNNGTIMKSNYPFYIHCEGHVISNGIWTPTRITLDGVDDQLIYLINNQEITCEVYFDALSAGTPYQWYYDAAILDSPDFTGETANNLVWQVPVSETWYGSYYCQTGAGPSRNIIVRGGLILDIAVVLEGAYNGIDMNTTLNDNGVIPLTQPYNIPPWNYAGTESVVSMPADVVDWVLVELRETAGGPETAAAGTMIDQRALLLRNDGEIVDLNGIIEMKFDIATTTDNVYMVVWHRNHLGIMTPNPMALDIAPIVHDFSSGEAQAYGNADAQKDLGGGIYGMMGGEADGNQIINDQDKLGFWKPNAGTSANYESFDFNMDNKVNNLDKNDIWVGNTGNETQVPD